MITSIDAKTRSSWQVPDFEVLENMTLSKMYMISPLAVVAIVMFGVTNAMFFGMFAVWTTQVGLSSQMTGVSFGCWTFGAVLLQWRRFDQTWVGVLLNF